MRRLADHFLTGSRDRIANDPLTRLQALQLSHNSSTLRLRGRWAADLAMPCRTGCLVERRLAKPIARLP
jgi:hypothetical protein